MKFAVYADIDIKYQRVVEAVDENDAADKFLRLVVEELDLPEEEVDGEDSGNKFIYDYEIGVYQPQKVN